MTTRSIRTPNQVIASLTIALLILPGVLFAQRLQQLDGHVPKVLTGMTSVAVLPESTPIDLIIGLPLRNAEALNDLLQNIYDPNSPHFHEYLSPEEYVESYCPTAASYKVLLDFAKTNGLDIVAAPANRKFLHVRAPARTINSVFHLTLRQYQHPTEKRLFYAPDVEPSVDLGIPVSYISGLDNLHLPGRFKNQAIEKKTDTAALAPASGSGNDGYYTGGDFRAAYAPDVSLTGMGQNVGIIELNGYNKSDINAYESKNGIPNVPIENVYLDGYAGDNPINESAADMELVMSMAPGISKAIVYGAPYDSGGIHDLLNELANPSRGEPRPFQITTSYYFFYDQNVYDSLTQLAAQGQALFVASGDFGAYDEVTGKGDFPPADFPYVTAVGGTELQTSGPRGQWTSEAAASFSGGGYSPWAKTDPHFAIPAWQAGMNLTLAQGSTTARNVPDVAIVADHISIYFDGQWQRFAGTSAAAPLWAAFMALANEKAANVGKPRVGSPNPALYSIGRSGTCSSCYHDITVGNNFNGSNPAKYKAVKGFDLVTGWGTPKGSGLIDALVSFGTGWALLPGGGTTNLPDSTTVFQNRLYVFGIGIGDHHHYVNSFDGNTWTGWSALPGGGTTDLADAAVTFKNRLYLFAVGAANHQHYMNSFDGSNWSGWSLLPGGGTTYLADAATVFNDRLYLFAVGGANHEHYMNSFDGSNWSGWSLVPGGGTTYLADAATVFNDRLYLFAVGGGNHEHYMNSFDGFNWSGWSVLPGGGVTAVSDAATVFQNRLCLISIGENDHRHYINKFDGSSWSGWSLLPGGGTTELPDAATVYENMLYVFSIGINDHEHYLMTISH